jgi:hypothetical protein
VLIPAVCRSCRRGVVEQPFQAATSLAGATLPGGSTPLPFAAATVTAGAAFLLVAAAARITLPRDIT